MLQVSFSPVAVCGIATYISANLKQIFAKLQRDGKITEEGNCIGKANQRKIQQYSTWKVAGILTGLKNITQKPTWYLQTCHVRHTISDDNRGKNLTVINIFGRLEKKPLGHQRCIWVPESPGASPAALSWSDECPPAVSRSSGPPCFSTAWAHQPVVQDAWCSSPPPHTYDLRSTGKDCFHVFGHDTANSMVSKTLSGFSNHGKRKKKEEMFFSKRLFFKFF